jgi:hypothetical protein
MVRRVLLAVVVTCAPALALPVGAPAAARTPTSSLTSLVTLGDSFISGEAGRWKGNSIVSTTDRAGTDRAWTGTGYDPSRVYGTTAANGCHRSDVAEAVGVVAPVQRRFNLACSGASTVNLFRASNGGQAFKGEASQADQLRFVSQLTNTKIVVLSIGGNDLGFADIIRACAQAYAARTGPCRSTQQAAVDARRQAAFAGVAKAIDEVRAVMTASSFQPKDYRLIVQSYGSPVPRASEDRYAELDPQRASVGGCPFYDTDLNWARDSLVQQIADGLRFVAAAKGVEYLDLRNSLQGHEVCATAARQATLTDQPSAATSEWARFLTLNLVQGDVQETLHPNVFGQQALARCLTLAIAAGRGNGSCRATAGRGPDAMTYTR